MRHLILIILSFCFSYSLSAGNDPGKSASRTIHGVITTTQGEPLAGARIEVSETGEVFYSGLDGRFSINLETGKSSAITVSSIGYAAIKTSSGQLHNFCGIELSEL